jgi:hypothetical protein
MKIFKKVLIGLLIVFVLIQFIRPKRNVSAQTSSNDITLMYHVPGDVKTILNKACNDCHSNNTKYPWYAEIQPVAWWLSSHIEDGKHELNFNEFASYRPRKQYRRMEQTAELVKEGEMPLKSYTLLHADAKLTENEKQTLYAWTDAVMDTMKARYPIDSLLRKK